MDPRYLLRVEGGTALAVAGWFFLELNGLAAVPLWALLPLFFAPDLSMVGYLAGPRVGAATYNAAHTYVAPTLLAAAGLSTATPLATALAVIWACHIGFDRLLGYGLKHESGFKDTHLGAPSYLPDGVAATER
jgi:hypothetical protein